MDKGNFDENSFQQGAAQEPPFFFREIIQWVYALFSWLSKHKLIIYLSVALDFEY